MSKGKDIKKNVKKAPALTAKEKKAKKREKKVTRKLDLRFIFKLDFSFGFCKLSIYIIFFNIEIFYL